MNANRIKEIQKETGFPDSVSVQQALLKVWNECEQGRIKDYSAGEEVYVECEGKEATHAVAPVPHTGEKWKFVKKLTRPTVSEDHYRKAVEWIDGMITCPKNVADFKTRAYRIAKIAAGKELNR